MPPRFVFFSFPVGISITWRSGGCGFFVPFFSRVTRVPKRSQATCSHWRCVLMAYVGLWCVSGAMLIFAWVPWSVVSLGVHILSFLTSLFGEKGMDKRAQKLTWQYGRMFSAERAGWPARRWFPRPSTNVNGRVQPTSFVHFSFRSETTVHVLERRSRVNTRQRSFVGSHEHFHSARIWCISASLAGRRLET